ncbi:MAG TPA: acyltransferase domain-containing protein [Solirubrobacterales bacterium]|jgi:enediyne polyketide synthase
MAARPSLIEELCPPCLLAVAGPDAATVRDRLESLMAAERHPESIEQLASRLADEIPADCAVRCAIVASTVEEAREGVADAAGALGGHGLSVLGRAFVGFGSSLRIGLLFPGQGAPVRTDAGGLGERVPEAAEILARAGLPADPAEVADEKVQLSVVASSLAALAALHALGVEATIAAGHSLGELTALHWAGALDADALLRLAGARGAAMTGPAVAKGTMATVLADDRALVELTSGRNVTVACLNSPRQRVVSGGLDEIQEFVDKARESGIRATRLDVIGAFHSPLMRPAVADFERSLEAERFEPLRRRVISSVTGGELESGADLRSLLARQIVDPVRFSEAGSAFAAEADLMLEVGPGRILSRLMAEIGGPPAVSMRVGERSSAGLIEAGAAAFAAGAPVAVGRLTKLGAVA